MKESSNVFESDAINTAKQAVVNTFRNNFNYQNVVTSPDKETLDLEEVIITEYELLDSGWKAKAKTVFDDGFIFLIKYDTIRVHVTIIQTIQTVSYSESDLIEGAPNA